MDGVSCLASLESELSLFAGYRRLELDLSVEDDTQPMWISSSEEETSEDSDLEGATFDRDFSALTHMTDSLDLRPLLGPSVNQGPVGSLSEPAVSGSSLRSASWRMRAQLDDNNANTVVSQAHLATMSRTLSAAEPGVSPVSPAVEKADIEGSEKVSEINGNVVIYKDGVRPKEFDKTRAGRHAAKSPKHRRTGSVSVAPAASAAVDKRDLHVHFSNDAFMPRKQEKTLMNNSVKMGFGSPQKPSRPTSLPVTSLQPSPKRGRAETVCHSLPPAGRLTGRPQQQQQQQRKTSPPAPVQNGPLCPPDVASGEPKEGSIGAEAAATEASSSSVQPAVRRRDKSTRREDKLHHRKSCPAGPPRDEKHSSPSDNSYNSFDVYNLETSLPKIDWEAIENHLKTVKEEERKRRNDREMIRRKLAMGPEAEEVAALTGSGAGVGCPAARKPSLQSRLQGGMSLQICFMNETASDDEGGEDDDEDEFRSKSGLLTRQISSATQQVDESSSAQPLPVDLDNWPKFSQPPCVARDSSAPERAADFARHQAQLQREARLALAQAQQMARWQMDVERQSRRSPISDVVRQAFQKIGVSFPDGRRRVSRQILTEMNIAQLQLIVNDLHTRIEGLNEGLVRYLMERDELHMEQDSKLVHIEDLTSYYGQKHQGLRIQPTPTDPTDLTSVSGAASKPAKARSLRLSLSKNK